MIILCAVFLLLSYQHVQCQTDNYDDPSSTPYHPPAPTAPQSAKNKTCSTTSHISRSQLPYRENDDNFYCGNNWWEEWIYKAPYIRIITTLENSGDFQLRVAVKQFYTETVGPYASNFYRGFWIANSNETANFQPGTDIPNGVYAINCLEVSDCSFTADPNMDVDIFIYFDDYAINNYSFVIEDMNKSHILMWYGAAWILLGVSQRDGVQPHRLGMRRMSQPQDFDEN